MSGILAVCNVHGPFMSSAFHGGYLNNAMFENVGVTCSECGGTARVVDGTFHFRAGVQEVVDAPGWTRDSLRAVQQAAKVAEESIRRNPHDADLAVQELAENADAVNPGVGNWILKLLSELNRDQQIAAIGVLIAALSLATTVFVALGANGSSSEIDRMQETQIQDRKYNNERAARQE